MKETKFFCYLTQHNRVSALAVSGPLARLLIAVDCPRVMRFTDQALGFFGWHVSCSAEKLHNANVKTLNIVHQVMSCKRPINDFHLPCT